MKILYRSKIEIDQSPWTHWFYFDAVYENGKRVKIYAGTSGEALFGYLEWSEGKGELTEQQQNQWGDYVIEKYISGNKECDSEICFYAENNNQHVEKYLHSLCSLPKQ